MSLSNESIWSALLLGIALKSTAVLAVAWLITVCLRGRSAASRHLVWTAACAALLALPLLSIALPSVQMPMGRAFLAPAAVFETTGVAPSGSSGVKGSPRVSAIHTVNSAPGRPDWRLWMMALWGAGATAVFARMLLGSVALWKLRRSARPFAATELGPLTGALGIRHKVDVLENSRGSMPLTFGLLRPAVFMPSDAVEWSAERRLVVLLHELAHVRRGDIATQLLARTALSLNWWNPLAWIAWREFLKERERAADDLVLSTGARASAYADHLLAIARTMRVPSIVGSAALAIARPSQLEDRLLAILDSSVNRKAPGRAFTLAATVLAVGLVAPVAALRGQDSAAQAIPADVDASIRAAVSQKNFAMLDSAADAAQAARKYDIAHTLLEASLAIRLDASGAQSREYGVGLLRLAELEAKRGHSGDPQALYAKAALVLGERPQAATALIFLGIYEMQKDPERAMEYFEHAKLVDPKNTGPANMWMAVLTQRRGRVAEAETLYRSALAAQNASSSEAATTMELYADFLRQQKREDEAKGMQERALTLRKATVAQADNPNVFRMGKGVISPKLLSKVEPEYTEEARAAKYQGTTTLSVEVGPDGLAHNIQIVRGLGLGLNDRAMEAVSQWTFQPGTKDGQAVTVVANIDVNWKLM